MLRVIDKVVGLGGSDQERRQLATLRSAWAGWGGLRWASDSNHHRAGVGVVAQRPVDRNDEHSGGAGANVLAGVVEF